MNAPPQTRPFLIGLSGPTCSGKTTLARLLQTLFPHTVLLHEDDFYRPAADLSFRGDFQNWDGADSIDHCKLLRVLQHVKDEGAVPPGLASNETYEEDAAKHIAPERLEELRQDIRKWAAENGVESLLQQGSPEQPAIVLLDGFLLFGKSTLALWVMFDVCLLLRGRYAAVKARRGARRGYVTDEGFWEDPEGYFDEVVWPEYVEEHGHLYKEGNVEGEVCAKVTTDMAIDVCPNEEIPDMLDWAVERLKKALVTQTPSRGTLEVKVALKGGSHADKVA